MERIFSGPPHIHASKAGDARFISAQLETKLQNCISTTAVTENQQRSLSSFMDTLTDANGKLLFRPRPPPHPSTGLLYVAVKELRLSYHNGETLLSTIHIYIYMPIMVTSMNFLKTNPVLRTKTWALQADPMLRRDAGRSLQDAEELALKTLETLLKTPRRG